LFNPDESKRAEKMLELTYPKSLQAWMRIRRPTSQHSTYPGFFPWPGWEPERAKKTPICYISERTRQLQDTQKKEQRAAKEPEFYRNNPDDTQSDSDKQKRDNNSEDKVLFHYKYKCYKIYKIHNSPGGCLTSQTIIFMTTRLQALHQDFANLQ
jgi:hypothetical protein